MDMKANAMTYFDLGPYSRKVTTSSPDAQLWFDRGLNWLFGFNHGEAIKCFQKALNHDGECAMAHWGMSYASGPNYNLPWLRYDPLGRQMALTASYDAMQGALAHAGEGQSGRAGDDPGPHRALSPARGDRGYGAVGQGLHEGDAQGLRCLSRRSRGPGGLCRVDHERDAVADVGPALRQACRGSGHRGMQDGAGSTRSTNSPLHGITRASCISMST